MLNTAITHLLGVKMKIPGYLAIVAFWILTNLYIVSACVADLFEFRGSCYSFSRNTSSFYSSKSSCDDLGMHMVEIGSQEEQDFLVGKIQQSGYPEKDYWIGLTAVTWLDGTPLTYDKFGSVKLGAFNQDARCFRMFRPYSSEWYDDDCNDANHYICEAEEACDGFNTNDGLDFHESNGSCYHVSPIASAFSKAKSNCEDIGMHLAFIGSQTEQEGVVELLSNEGYYEYWIGLTRSGSANDGSADPPYHNFGSKSSSFGDGVCYRMEPATLFHWLGDDCHSERHFICEKEESEYCNALQWLE
ncbi:secretory phospholipase A2 receptor-like [Lytechinus variegatus]|uniref:secretory phospholipase A2 receptor-like n=1 Tax=Lytechinus variegatus TaxID=7654 RepID=UPI001BB10620|nr:secretory phospholipase A2 receptor-like [Lytechinus variegatus]